VAMTLDKLLAVLSTESAMLMLLCWAALLPCLACLLSLLAWVHKAKTKASRLRDLSAFVCNSACLYLHFWNDAFFPTISSVNNILIHGFVHFCWGEKVYKVGYRTLDVKIQNRTLEAGIDIYITVFAEEKSGIFYIA
jgi:hypothetical protein